MKRLFFLLLCLPWLATAQTFVDADPMSGLIAVSEGITFSSAFIETADEGKRLYDAVLPIDQTIDIGIRTPRGFVIDEKGEAYPGVALKLTDEQGKVLASMDDVFHGRPGMPAGFLSKLNASITANAELDEGMLVKIQITIFDKKGPNKARLEVQATVRKGAVMMQADTEMRILDSPGCLVEGYYAKPSGSGFAWDSQKGAKQLIVNWRDLSFNGYTSEMHGTGNIGMKLPYRFQLVDRKGKEVWRVDGETTVTGRGIYVKTQLPAVPKDSYLLVGKLGNTSSSIVASSAWIHYGDGGGAGNAEKSLGDHYATLCDFFIAGGQHEKALVCAENAIQLGVSSKEILRNKGLAHQELGHNVSVAIALFEKAIAADSTFADAWIALGAAYKEMGNKELAYASLLKAASLAPGNYEAQYDAAWICNDMGRYEEALPFLDKAVQLNKDRSSQPYHERAFAYKQLQQYKKAALDYEKVTAIEPYNWQAFYNKGYNYIDAADYERAAAALETALDLNPSSYDAQYELAYTYKAWGKFQEAIDAFEKAIGMIGNASGELKGRAYRHKGDCFKEIGQQTEACASYTEAQRLGAELDEKRMQGCD